MKKIISLLLLLVSTTTAFAQTQQGVVKTRGRMVNGQLVAGSRLSGATITLNFGNPQVSQGQGTFSFNVPTGKSYSLVSAKKQGYTLADPEYTRRTFKYSASNPFYVVLEDEVQRQADINAATRKVRKTLTAQLEKREEEIEALKEQNRITEQEYQQRLKELYDNQSKSEQLVKEMAEHYASTDYDQLDEFNRQVQLYIEEGELLRADSMIQSKGSLEDRLARLQQYDQANSQREEEIRQQQEDLIKSKELAEKEREDLSQDLYNKSIIAQQQYNWDEALHCLKMRADMDSTNVDAVFEYAILCYKQRKFSESEKYYLISLRACPQHDLYNNIRVLNNLATLCVDMHDYSNGENYYYQALRLIDEELAEESETFLAEIANIHNNMGALYFDSHDFSNSE